MTRVLKERDAGLAVILSALFHLLLVLLFLIVKVKLKIEVPEFTEITFVSGNNKIVAPSASQRMNREPAVKDNDRQELTQVVKLPERKMD